jgi:hypothetical protein
MERGEQPHTEEKREECNCELAVQGGRRRHAGRIVARMKRSGIREIDRCGALFPYPLRCTRATATEPVYVCDQCIQTVGVELRRPNLQVRGLNPEKFTGGIDE